MANEYNNEPITFDLTGQKELNLGLPKYRIMVGTPVHSECSIHYTQALLKFQQQCMQRNISVSYTHLTLPTKRIV